MHPRKSKPVGARPIVLPTMNRAPASPRPPRILDYKDKKSLSPFLTDGGKILPRRASNLSLREQKALKIAVKRARILAVLPFARRHEEK